MPSSLSLPKTDVCLDDAKTKHLQDAARCILLYANAVSVLDALGPREMATPSPSLIYVPIYSPVTRAMEGASTPWFNTQLALLSSWEAAFPL